MGKKKKHYHYDKPQYRDENNNLLFLLDKIPNDYNGETHLFTDCYNKLYSYNTLDNLKRDFITYSDVIKGINISQEYPPGKNPKSYHIALRTRAVHLCLEKAYTNINEESKPTLQNIADIFGINTANLFNLEKKYQSELKKVPEIEQELVLLANFITL